MIHYLSPEQCLYLWHCLKCKHILTSLNDYPKWPCSAACTVQMLCQRCSCWQRFRELPWYSAIWHRRPIRGVLPTHLKSVVACGCRFSCRNCDDSVLIIIKSTCMTGCRPLMLFITSENWGMVGSEAVCVGGCVHVCVRCMFVQTFG